MTAGSGAPAHARLDRVGIDVGVGVGVDRVARGQVTRRHLAEALMELLRAGETDPTAKAVAGRAGVPLRLVFHHFADLEDLYQFAATLLIRRQWVAMPQVSPRLALATRIERTVAHRAALFEETSAIRRALQCRAPTSPAIRQALAAGDHLFVQDLEATFAAELADLPGSLRADTLSAMDAGTSWEAWERLRTTSGLPVRRARRVMSLVLENLCGRTAPAAVGPAPS